MLAVSTKTKGVILRGCQSKIVKTLGPELYDKGLLGATRYPRYSLTKELIYVAVSVTNGCAYCIASHTAAAQQAGMSAAMFAELMAVIGMAHTTNRLAHGYQVDIDDRFRTPAPVVGHHGEPLVAAGA